MRTKIIFLLIFISKITFCQYSSNRIPFIENNRFGLSDTNGKVILPPTYNNIRTFESGKALVTIDSAGENYYNFIDFNGKKLFNQNLTSLPKEFYNGYTAIYSEGKESIIDTNGKTVVPAKYQRANLFDCELATVACSFWTWGAIDKSGKEIIPCIYDDIGSYFDKELNKVKKDDKWALIDNKGTLLTKFEYDEIGDPILTHLQVEGNLIVAKKGKNWGYIDRKGKNILPYIYTSASNFHNNIATVQLNEKFGFIDSKGDKIIPIEYDDLCNRSDSLFPASKNGKYGYIDKKNKIVIPFEYDLVYNFKENRAFVCKNKKCGFIDYSNKSVVPFILNDEILLEFEDGLCWTNYNGIWCYIDKNGKIYAK